MKKWIGSMLAALWMLLNFACAEELPVGEFVRLQDGAEIVLSEYEAFSVRFATDGMEEGVDYLLQIDGCEPAADDIFTIAKPELLAVRYADAVYFFVGGASESAWNRYHVYEYAYDSLYRMPGEFAYCDGDGSPAPLPRATKYGSFFVDVYDITDLGGFVHEQEYVIASNARQIRYDEAYVCGVYEVPKGMYPFGAVVEIRKDLPLLTDRNSGAETVTIPEGANAVIVASDAESWARIEQIGGAEGEIMQSGWLKINPMIIDGETTNGFSYMSGISVGG